jgi:acetyl-CoA acetyltransferase
VLYAARAIAAGDAHTVLVCESDSRGAKFKGDKIQAMRAARPWTDDWEDPFGLTVPGKYALIAQRWMHRHGRGREDLAAVAVAARAHAMRQPHAPRKEPLAMEKVLGSAPIAAPLHAFDCCPVADWGGAVLVTSVERARDMRQPVVRLLGAGEGHCAYHVADIDDLPPSATRQSAEAAFGIAGVKPGDIDTAQVFDAFTIAALVAMEELGFCEPGAAGSLFAGGHTALGGSIPTIRSRAAVAGEKQGCAFFFQVIHPDAISGGAFVGGRNQQANVKAVLSDVLGHGNEQCMLPGQLEAQAAARCDAAGGLLFSQAEIEALNEIAIEAGVAPFDVGSLPTA